MNEKTIKCFITSFGISLWETLFQKKKKKQSYTLLTYLDIAKAWTTTRNSNSFSQAINDDHYYFKNKIINKCLNGWPEY